MHHGWYLVAWCRLRQAARTFRLDRIRQVSATGEAIVPRPLDALLAEIPLDFAEPVLQ
jgi:predicted DNA-binding transcriptional regulator YafY